MRFLLSHSITITFLVIAAGLGVLRFSKGMFWSAARAFLPVVCIGLAAAMGYFHQGPLVGAFLGVGYILWKLLGIPAARERRGR